MVFEIAISRVVPALIAGADVSSIRETLLSSGVSEENIFLAIKAAEVYLNTEIPPPEE